MQLVSPFFHLGVRLTMCLQNNNVAKKSAMKAEHPSHFREGYRVGPEGPGMPEGKGRD
jgi:hypothetical protein